MTGNNGFLIGTLCTVKLMSARAQVDICVCVNGVCGRVFVCFPACCASPTQEIHNAITQNCLVSRYRNLNQNHFI